MESDFTEDMSKAGAFAAGAAKSKTKKTTKRKTAKPKRTAKLKTAKRKPKTGTKSTASKVRTERLDMRLTKAEKARIGAKAKKTRRTVTSLVIEAIEKIR